ncbi:cupin domain-containing protein [Aeromicrobium sp. UC242_57]|uniref:cupin domain-containing protein n=1 Tax=Aeromicrobium sp. UC242_57 TaxID=3374624 RepID=UPI003789C39E
MNRLGSTTPSLLRALLLAPVIVLALALSSCGRHSVPAPHAEAATQAPVSAVDHAAGRQDGPVKVSVAGQDGVGVTFREITLAPGASTGKHCHYGQLIAVVKKGALTHYADTYPDGVHVYETGASIIEGAGYAHEGRNEGDDDVVLWVTYVIPEGKPLAEPDLANCDA